MKYIIIFLLVFFCNPAFAQGTVKKETPLDTPPPAAAVEAAPVPEPAKSVIGPKPATEFTKKANEALRLKLPLSDQKDFENASRGLISILPNKGIVKNEKGEVVWDPSQFDFISPDENIPDTVNPSLWRQEQLVLQSGLFKVTDQIYQVRGYDLSNITFIEGKTGIIVMDPLVSKETAHAALELYYTNRPKKPVTAVIYSHSHVDHYGGVKGVTTQADVDAGKVKIYAPAGFTQAAISENVMTGNVMSRRASYQYGTLLPKSAQTSVGTGLGLQPSTGEVTLILPTVTITETGETHTIDGLDFVFLMAPDSEAPSEMMFYIPKLKALTAAEDAVHTMHNIYTLRGAKIRDAKAWAQYLQEAIEMWGDEAEVLFAPHHWPVWDNENVVTHLKNQRDLYKYMNDQSLRLANKGLTMTEIAEQLRLPASLERDWSSHDYYGTLNHNAKSVYVHYLGWYNGNPATLFELPQVERGKKYVEALGGAAAVLAKGREAFAKGDYRWAAELVNHLVLATSSESATEASADSSFGEEARNLQADTLEQLGYQTESGTWRNHYLSAAQELRNGIRRVGSTETASPDTLKAMPMEMIFDYMAVHLNGPFAQNKKIVINFDFTGSGEKWILDLENSVLHYYPDQQDENADCTLTLSRETLMGILLEKVTLKDAIASGAVTVTGDPEKFEELMGLFDKFDFWFSLVTGN